MQTTRLCTLGPFSTTIIALAVSETIITVLVATGHVANRAICTSERLSRLLRLLPVALKRVRGARIEFTDFAVDDLVTFRIKKLYPPGTEAFAAYGTELA